MPGSHCADRKTMRDMLWIPWAKDFVRTHFGDFILAKLLNGIYLTPTAELFKRKILKKQLTIVQGGVGCGKTLCAARKVLGSIAARGKVGAYAKASDLSLLIGRGGYLTSSKEEAIEKLKQAPWVIIDDLGVEVCSEHFKELFFHLVDAWCARGITSIFITNLEPTSWENRYGERTWSRIRAWSKDRYLETADPDFRVAPEKLTSYPREKIWIT